MKTPRLCSCYYCGADLTAVVKTVTRDMGRKGTRTMKALAAPKRVNFTAQGVTNGSMWLCAQCLFAPDVFNGAISDWLIGLRSQVPILTDPPV